MKSRAFNILRYANCWEDPCPLLSSFNQKKGPNLLSIGSGGDNSFSLLSLEPKNLYVMDLNPVQLSTIRFKIQGLLRLSKSAYLKLLGYRPFPYARRWDLYQREIQPFLPKGDVQ